MPSKKDEPAVLDGTPEHASQTKSSPPEPKPKAAAPAGKADKPHTEQDACCSVVIRRPWQNKAVGEPVAEIRFHPGYGLNLLADLVRNGFVHKQPEA